jgi:hypothetical protein
MRDEHQDGQDDHQHDRFRGRMQDDGRDEEGDRDDDGAVAQLLANDHHAESDDAGDDTGDRVEQDDRRARGRDALAAAEAVSEREVVS